MEIKNGRFLLELMMITCYICNELTAENSKNIAFQKPAFQSSQLGDGYASKAVDGSYNQMYCAHGDMNPSILNWLIVDLLEEYYVSKVVLTPRNSQVGTLESKRMDYVYIGISNSNVSGNVEYPVYPLCRQSPYTADPNQNMSISCRPNTPSGRYVIVQQPTTQYGYLTICEIQVFGTMLNMTGYNICQGNYYGDKCDKYCNCDKGVKCDQQGYCPNGCDVNWEGEHCDIRKYSNQLIGCFQLNETSTRQFLRAGTSSCLTTCSGYGFTFATYKSSNECICTDSLNWIVPVRCGELKNKLQNGYEVTFYSVCPSGSYGYNCTLKCNCHNNGRCSYMEGRCEDGCPIGFTGNFCDSRVCSNNSECNENEICSPSSNVMTCQFKEEFIMSSTWSPCLTIGNSIQPNTGSINTTALVGAVIGSAAGLIIILTAVILLFKYRKLIWK